MQTRKNKDQEWEWENGAIRKTAYWHVKIEITGEVAMKAGWESGAFKSTNRSRRYSEHLLQDTVRNTLLFGW